MVKKHKRVLQGMINIAKQGYMNAVGLRKYGENSEMVVFHDDYLQQGFDYNLNIRKSEYWLYPYYIVKILIFFILAVCKYSIFHFHYGKTMLPLNLDLLILKLLKKHIFMEYHGGDIRFKLTRDRGCFDSKYEICNKVSSVEKKCINRIFKYSECIILHDSELRRYLANYSGDVAYVPLRINVEEFTPLYPNPHNKNIVIVHAPTSRSGKGTEFIVNAIERLKRKYKFEFIMVENMTNEQAMSIYRKADIVIDQLIAGTYGVLSIESMAMGKPVICYISDMMKSEFPEDLPILSATTDNIGEKVEQLVKSGNKRYELGIKGRKYVESYHNYEFDTKLLNEIYSGRYRNISQKEAFMKVKEFAQKRDK